MTKRDGNLAVADGELVSEAQHSLVLALGRGTRGKSTFIRWAAERSMERGGEPVIGDADRTNATLTAYPHLTNVKRPPSPEDDDVRNWLNDFLEQQIEERHTAFIDLGGGDLVLKTWARDLDLVPFLTGYGIRPVALHFLGADLDDLAYLRDIETSANFRPDATAIILNEGTVLPGRSVAEAFKQIVEHDVFRATVARGARVLRMPRLGCMHEVDRRRLSFQDAQEGNVRPGQDKLGPVKRQMVALWRREMEDSFASIIPWIS